MQLGELSIQVGDTDYKLPAGWSNENHPNGDGWLETDSSCVWWMEIDMVVPPTPGARRLQERRAVPRAGMSAAAALLEATGIDPAAPVWGAPFREMAALYDGADPPLETFGVSAKFSNGKAATARYYVALELPGSGGHLPRDAQRRAAARTAAALKAPPLVDAWLDVLATEAPPPVYGFGVDADAVSYTHLTLPTILLV